MLAMAAGGAVMQRHQSRLYKGSSSSSSQDKLIVPELESSSSSSGQEEFSRASSDLDETALRQRINVHSFPSYGSSSWSFEGDCPQKKKKKNKKRNLLHGEDSTEQHNVGRCVAGCAADCTALCCCPLTVFHIMALLCVRVPSRIAAKVSRAFGRDRKSKKKNKHLRSEPSIPSTSEAWTPSLTPSVSYKQGKVSTPKSGGSSLFNTPSGGATAVTPSPSLPSPPQLPIHSLGFGGQHLWKEFDSGHWSFTSP